MLALQLLGEHGESTGVTRDQHEVVPPRRESLREGTPDAGRRAGHERDAGAHERSSAAATVAVDASTGSPTCTSAMARCGSFSP